MQATMTEPRWALEMEGISKSFGGVQALRDVTIRVAHGRVLGLVGQNGAGKSTLMKILDGAYPVGTFSGSLRLHDVPVALHSPGEAIGRGIGIVPQETSVVDTLTVAENVTIGRPGGPLHHPRASRDRCARFLAERGIDLDVDRLGGELNTSQKQLVMIARTLYMGPRILILDEPTTALTPPEVARLFAIVRSLRDSGVACILISHKLDEVFDVCDDIVVLRDGGVADALTRAEFDEGRVVRAMIGRQMSGLYPPHGHATPGEPALVIEHLVVPDPAKPNRRLVDDLSFEVRAGEIVGLGGALGSGRTETLSAVYGLLPYEGRIVIRGTAVRFAGPEQAISAGVQLVPEDRKRDGLFLNMSLMDNLTASILRRLSRGPFIDGRARRASAVDAVQRFAIRGGALGDGVARLSGGNQQKALIARTVAGRPSVLLLDEPTKGVDVGAKEEIYRFIRAMAADGVAVLAVFSDTSELVGVCDRVIVLSRGRVEREVRATESSEEDLMLAALSGSATAGRHLQ
jgi:ABC-type sugar transport system ATPase subunit